MLKTVIKRDGSQQEADYQKIVNWSLWAMKGLEKYVDWTRAVRYVTSGLNEVEKTSTINAALKDYLIDKNTWAHNLMAGRIYLAEKRKEIFGKDGLPSVEDQFNRMYEMGLMKKFEFSPYEWKMINNLIDHQRDWDLTNFQGRQIVQKYGISDRSTRKGFETPQYTFMRMACALGERVSDSGERLRLIRDYYTAFSTNAVNAPTPNYTNFGTLSHGFASCCVSESGDTAESLAAGELILYTATYSGMGTGHLYGTRTTGDKVRNGYTTHQGKFPYFRASAGNVKANKQGGRGGANTTYISVFDPEIDLVVTMQSPRALDEFKVRDIHSAVAIHPKFLELALEDKEANLFTIKSAPEAYESLFSGDTQDFDKAYEEFSLKYDPKVKKVNARDLLLKHKLERAAAATQYEFYPVAANKHTPFKDKIHLSNLCTEIMEPTHAYVSPEFLYKEEDHGKGEIALCSLAANNVAITHYLSDEEYENIIYLAVRMADTTIDMAEYRLPHMGYTARARRSVGIGITGLATVLAKEGVQYDTVDGRNLIHQIFERHAYFCIKASLKLGKELGNAPWMYKTKWPEGWTPLSTYYKSVDNLVSVGNNYDWDTLRQEIIDNGGIRNSVVMAHMPAESSSKATGSPNSVYPIRELFLTKSDADNQLDWVVTDGDSLKDAYQFAYDIDPIDMIKAYAVMQKWTDQGISADTYLNRSTSLDIRATDALKEVAACIKYGIKALYYCNSKTSAGNTKQEDNCSSGACKM